MDGSTAKSYLPGYDGSIDLPSLFWLLTRLLLALYLVASALTAFDAAKLSAFWVVTRLVIAVLLLIKIPYIAITAFILGCLLVLIHQIQARLGSEKNKAAT